MTYLNLFRRGIARIVEPIPEDLSEAALQRMMSTKTSRSPIFAYPCKRDAFLDPEACCIPEFLIAQFRRSKGLVMRLALLALCGLLVSAQLLPAQQPAPKHHKVLTPEQQAYQQQMKQYAAERTRLQAQSKQAYEAEMTREKGGEQAGECKGANSQSDWNICLGNDARITETNYAAFTAALRAMLAQKVPVGPGEDPNFVGLTGKPLSSEELVKLFDTLQALWRKYFDLAETTGYDQFRGGSGAPSFGLQCRRDVMRSHLHELHLLYGDLWL
jgi:hypothetical protein